MRPVVVIVRGACWLGAVTVTEAVPDLVGSAMLTAVTVTCVFFVTLGALYIPVVLIAPSVADQVTPTLLVFVTTAVNWTVPLDCTAVLPGFRTIPTAAEFETVIWKPSAPDRPLASTT